MGVAILGGNVVPEMGPENGPDLCRQWGATWGLQWRRGPENGTIFMSLLGPSCTSRPAFLQNTGAKKACQSLRFGMILGRRSAKLLVPFLGPENGPAF